MHDHWRYPGPRRDPGGRSLWASMAISVIGVEESKPGSRFLLHDHLWKMKNAPSAMNAKPRA